MKLMVQYDGHAFKKFLEDTHANGLTCSVVPLNEGQNGTIIDIRALQVHSHGSQPIQTCSR